MEFIIENWYIIVATATVIAMLGFAIYLFVNKPTSEQLTQVREWLLWAVTEAERELGSGTGKLKLRQVYDLFVVRFPWIAKVMTFAVFSTLVDDALIEMRKLLDTNDAVAEYVVEKAVK